MLIPFFDKYPLITQKRVDYELFKRAVEIMLSKRHFEPITSSSASGLQNIINIRASLNWGLPDSLKAAFPDTVKVLRPRVENKIIPHP